MASDFSKAFDTVDHTDLLSSINVSTRCLCTYLRGRTTSCSYNRRESSKVIIHQGDRQGSILSPQLFNPYVSAYPKTAELITSYADDFTVAASSSRVEAAAEHLARHAEDVTNWLERRSRQVSAQKSTNPLFTSQ